MFNWLKNKFKKLQQSKFNNDLFFKKKCLSDCFCKIKLNKIVAQDSYEYFILLSPFHSRDLLCTYSIVFVF